ncbi:hypothetical protein ASE85_19005 [Sphingobium sp. Leaf26]|uniref:hypothetical protein n=1 Tax=Sphingobium sp. Leaf26 TaxID=1735693 RepID=UPI0006FC4C18|nr:hypothetical protein [Sphingobium sp. Leaf26]KQN07152.1 hypothetical protein ASE85_19005 [Sphingobium sp. Leaf26]
MYLRKDESLDALAEKGNVAQFVAFMPEGDLPRQTYLRIIDCEPNQIFPTPEDAILALLSRSPEGTVNVRSYAPDNPRSREFIYALDAVENVLAAVVRLTREGLFTIVNETVDVADGGVSGVVQGDVIEFAPDDTPRCVEKPGAASLPKEMGFQLLKLVYGFSPDLGDAVGRVEFSIHPKTRGWRGTQTLLWEQEDESDARVTATLEWPNRFSRHIGDKLYGLLMAHIATAPVPRTLAVPRRVAPFVFGADTGSHEQWIRTCPTEQQPGLFTTHRGWLDPFKLLVTEDPTGTAIAAILSQAGVQAEFAGASLVSADGRTIVEGVSGQGDSFMLGMRLPQELPASVAEDVVRAAAKLSEVFGPVRTEWVHDGTMVWIVQLHRGATASTERVIVPGERANWIGFEAREGLEALRSLFGALDVETGVEIRGAIGVTSHMADLARKSGVPTRVVAI